MTDTPAQQGTDAQPALFESAAIPKGADPAAVVWCGYPAPKPWADCLLWRKGGMKVPRDCGDCVHRMATTEGVAHG